jgi:hypothetical protein
MLRSLIALGNTACYALALTVNSPPGFYPATSAGTEFHKQPTRPVAPEEGETTDIPEPAMPLLMGTGLIVFSVLVRKLGRSKSGPC